MRDGERSQIAYYERTASEYNVMHVGEADEHAFALHVAMGMFDYLGIESVLDVGSGTGRALSLINRWRPNVRVVGVEPVKELREQGYKNGLSTEQLIEGNGRKLPYEDGQFDMVCEFGVLHHVDRPDIVVKEMIRVARKAVFLSDCNIYGDRSPSASFAKNLLRLFGLWKLAVFARTCGKGYVFTEVDGVSYYYSVFDSFELLQSASSSVHFINTNPWTGVGKNMLWTADAVAMLGVIKQK
jgi:ubiquinone/menaquinone biosynthesis C-methylase UbiE